MKRPFIVPALLLILGILPACQPAPTQESRTLTPTRTGSTATLTYTPTPYDTPTASETPTLTITPTEVTFTITSSPTLRPIPTEKAATIIGEGTGVRAYGQVTLSDGSPLAGVSMYYAFSAYPGNFFAVTDENGEYSHFIPIPSDEMIRIWAELPGYTFKPGAGNAIWYDHEFAWRHYHGYQRVKLDFVAVGN